MNFTPSQSAAIFSRGSSILVSAGAGSGKTRVLTERLMAYIAPKEAGTIPAELDSFLIITFTRAAAGELRGRIASALTDRLREEPDSAHLRRQLSLSRNARISTIHAYCADLLREYAAQAGISPAFRILEEERAERLRSAALDRVLERHYNEGSDAFLQLASTVGAGRDDSRLAEQILHLHSAIQSHADPEGWVQEQISLLQKQYTDFSDTLWGRELLSETEKSASFWAEEMERCLSLMQPVEAIRKSYETSFSKTATALRRLQRAVSSEGWDSANAVLPIPFPRIGGIKNNPDPVLSEWLKKRRDSCKKATERIALNISGSSDEVLRQLRLTVLPMTQLLSLTMELEQEFQSSKRRINSLDFTDLEHRALALLQTPDGQATELAHQIAERYTEIMVDEYQDVSRVQDRLFHAISREGKNLFFVGDLKQSIYRFRLADPEIFTEKADTFSIAPLQGAGQLIRLQENFRSRWEVLQAVNRTFIRSMSRELGDLDFGPSDELIPAADYQGVMPDPELILLQREQVETEAVEAEAEAVALRIEELMRDTTVTKDGETRPLRYGDIAILLRAANSIGPVFRRALMKHGIPAASGAADDFYSSMEVAAVFAMLSVLDNPHQDIPLLTVLSSPCMGFSANQLSLIRACHPEDDFYTALCNSDDPDAIRFLSMLNRLRYQSTDLGPVDMVERVMEELDLYAVCCAMPDGDSHLRRLSALIQMAEVFQNSDEYGLHHFILWLRNLERRGQEPAGGAEGGDAVQILSIHKSKGLEFPVVFCSGLGRGFNRQDTRSTVLVHPVLGLGPRVTDPVQKTEYPSAARRAVELRLNRETLSEEMRLLYVAMTRARERLILTACVKKTDELLEQTGQLLAPAGSGLPPSGKIPASLLQNASCPLQWILPALVYDHAFTLTYGQQADALTEQRRDHEDEGNADPELMTLLEHNLDWQYPYALAEQIPSKVTPTELKHWSEEPDEETVSTAPKAPTKTAVRLPNPEKTLTAAQRGSAMHLVLQHIPFTLTGSEEEISGEIERLVRQNFLTREEADSVAPERIQAFFECSLGRRLIHATHCWKEFRFSLLNDAIEIFPDAAPGDSVLLQGVVDCCFEEDGELVLLDYKTDRIESEETLLQRIESYRPQLNAYKKALERIFRKPVKEQYLYFLDIGKEVRLV